MQRVNFSRASSFVCLLLFIGGLTGCSDENSTAPVAANPAPQPPAAAIPALPPAGDVAGQLNNAQAANSRVLYSESSTEVQGGSLQPGPFGGGFGSMDSSNSDLNSSADGQAMGMNSPSGNSGLLGGMGSVPQGAIDAAGNPTANFGALGAGANNIGFDLVTTFFQQNCVRCHGAVETKGNMRLDQLTAQFASAADQWRSILATLESGSMPPPVAPQPDPQQKMQMIEFIQRELSSLPQQGYFEQAESEFRRRDFKQAMRLYYAHVLSADESEASERLKYIQLYRPKVAKPEDLQPSNDSAVSVKPRLTTELTFAVGAILDVATNVTDVRPIGVKQAGGLAGGDLGMTQQGANPANNSRLENFEDLTGELGSTFLATYLTRRGEGKYGLLFKDISIKGKAPKTAQPGEQDGGATVPGGAALQAVAQGGFGFGQGMSAIPAFDGAGGGLGGAAKTAAGDFLANGLVYIGTGTLNELLQTSNSSAADGLFLFDIKATKNNRSGIVSNDTRVRFLLPSGKIAATTAKALNNIEIEKAAMRGKNSDDVGEQIDQFFGRLDAILALDQLPAMTEKTALKHIHGQLHSETDRLKILAEARLFRSKGIITQEQLELIYQVVLEGNEGLSLAIGSEEDRKLVLGILMEKL